jgi:hypothetical protein
VMHVEAAILTTDACETAFQSAAVQEICDDLQNSGTQQAVMSRCLPSRLLDSLSVSYGHPLNAAYTNAASIHFSAPSDDSAPASCGSGAKSKCLRILDVVMISELSNGNASPHCFVDDPMFGIYPPRPISSKGVFTLFARCAALFGCWCSPSERLSGSNRAFDRISAVRARDNPGGRTKAELALFGFQISLGCIV